MKLQYSNSAVFFVAIGNNAIREKITEQLFEKKAEVVSNLTMTELLDDEEERLLLYEERLSEFLEDELLRYAPLSATPLFL